MTDGTDEHQVKAIVLDIEGTTTPIAFVYDLLFPYARRHLRAYLQDPANAGALREPLRLLGKERAADRDGPADQPPPRLRRSAEALRAKAEAGHYRGLSHADDTEYIEWLMDHDRKSPGLKLLQGQIWERGYGSGELTGDVFPDVAPALRRWRDAGIDVSIYSSGSELAQRLLFGSTKDGDLTPLFSRFFDTQVGPKGAADSYRRIARELGRQPAEMLFVSDVTSELDAAREAGCQVLLCVRAGNKPQPEHAHTVIGSFTDIGPLWRRT